MMNKTFKKEISVIIPAFNEESNMRELIQRISNSLVLNGFFYEIIVIDDHSTDGTKALVERLSLTYPVSYFPKNGKKGKAYSLCEGFKKAIFSNLAFIDADLQYPPEEIVKMALMLKEFDVITANRKKYNDSFTRRVSSKVFKFVFGKTMFKLPYDIQSGLKVFKKEVVETVEFLPASAWTFDLEFLHKANQAGFRIGSHNIVFSKRKEGSSKIGLIKTTAEIGSKALSLRFRSVKPFSIPASGINSMKDAGMRYKKKSYVTHSTLSANKSAIVTFTKSQKAFLISLSALIVIFLMLQPLITLRTIITVLSFIYFLDVLFNLYLVVKSVRKKQEIEISKKTLDKLDDRLLPTYSILCPLYKEAHIIPQFVKSISKLSWPKDKLDVLLLLEEDDKESIAKAKKMNLPSFVRTIVVPNSQPKTKPKACNYGLAFAKGEYLVIFDAEDMPEEDQLKKAYAAFQKVGRDVVCLQAKLNYYNPNQNLLTRFFTAEYSLWFDITLTGLQGLNTSIPLGGTSNHFRKKDLLMLQGWDPFNVTEDADLGMRLFKEGHRTAIINSTTYEEANSKWGNWVRQRSRWIKGYMQTYLVHTRESVQFARKYKQHFPIFHLVVGGKIAFILINPFLWLATISYFALYAYVGPTIESLYPSYVFYIAMVSLVFGNFLFFYYYMIGLAKKEQGGLMKYTFLIPVYWIMISAAGFMALYQLFFKPFYWEKTLHGLHLKKQVAMSKPVKNKPKFRFGNTAGKVALPFVLVGNVERKIVSITFTLVKKIIITPVKYAASIIL